ncbi:MAG: hypothetical protein KJ077_10615 [Anaerolineae bacterium]|nr:hypothetical protein [Anaerolineae bacterium]
MIRLKFRCTQESSLDEAGMASYTFAVIPEATINLAHWPAKPQGQITLTAMHPNRFAVGHDYYLDFAMAPTNLSKETPDGQKST